MGCLACGRFLCSECPDISDGKCCHLRSTPTGAMLENLSNKTLIDPESTWRKRAAISFPIAKELPCEWRGKKDVGGGKYAIVGCIDGLQSTIHHGPVKIEIGITYNFNQEGNVHRICERCHHLWHHWNDSPYNWEEWALLPHSPTDATIEQLELWANSKTRPKPPDPRTKPINVGVD